MKKKSHSKKWFFEAEEGAWIYHGPIFSGSRAEALEKLRNRFPNNIYVAVAPFSDNNKKHVNFETKRFVYVPEPMRRFIEISSDSLVVSDLLSFHNEMKRIDNDIIDKLYDPLKEQ